MKRFYCFLWVLSTLLLSNCCDEPIKPDPCSGKSPVSADFMIYELPPLGFPEYWTPFDCDTVIPSNIVYFTAYEENASYEWEIGSEKIYEKSFNRTGFPGGAKIPVKLIVKKETDKNCFPDDDGCDTVVRYLYTLNYDKKTYSYYPDAVSGKFFGNNLDNPIKKFSIYVQSGFVKPGGDSIWDKKIRVKGLIDSCDLFEWDLTKRTFKQYYFAMYYNYDCLNPKGLLTVFGINNDSIKIQYSIQKLPGSKNTKERINKTFIGVRIYE